MNVPFFDTQRTIEALLPTLEVELEQMMRQATLVNGAQVRRLEQAICDYTGARHAIATGNATDSLIIALMAAGIGPGDEVIVPCYSFFASLSCVLHVGATPVFVDIEEGSYAMNADAIEARITPRTRAIMPVHLFRQMADMGAIQGIAARHGLLVLEDSAEGIGMRHDGRHAGLLGAIGVLSFFPTKTLGALGDAGMILTDDADYALAARQIADNGRDTKGIAQRNGFNSRMDDLQALYLRLRLPGLAREIGWRAHCAALYQHGLAELAPNVAPARLLARPAPQTTVDYAYVIEAEQRDALAAYLAGRGIGTEVYYPRPLHLQPCCRHMGHREGDFPVAEAASRRALGLPMYADLSEDAVMQVCSAISDFYRLSPALKGAKP
ncbi:DegT/DnrJ/EryC1/StrS family aminotransferase [Rugamonas sp. CCM 8940]|uniref:DegT/DnrJ/EryC1/StrS family aminotransferase n=1 Tax=Rugamonas sp. CCM 8940 TaxID=2765359 RepID=UPI0018F71A77|nr:DegT/DnrJ/EryC1/StrS family aminotransferase [Rugamonas sp. CCM 8940]MBJ7311272.1 DegT/DnrJ/EryC1/StrS family aminotransferase [Rugamonas sp. CCM 8940]